MMDVLMIVAMAGLAKFWLYCLRLDTGEEVNDEQHSEAMIECTPCPSTQFDCVHPPIVTDEDRAFSPRVIRFLTKGEKFPSDRETYTYGTGGEVIPIEGGRIVREDHVFFVYLISLWEERKAGYRLPSPLPRASVVEDEEEDDELLWQLHTVPSDSHN